ncbi:MAG: hypothetical protein VXZ39_15455 [Planctomycetota bacterium]|nr:hypothetical protein [Planctomycetota bacterium]MEC8512533.1 hypothetical protein [Planctomycetota bacterium]
MVGLNLAPVALAASVLPLLATSDAAPAAGVALAQEDAGGTSWLAFPDEPLGRPWASVGAGTKAWTFLAEPGSEALEAEGGPWPTWAADLGIVASSEPSPERREAIARLCRFAARDGRPDDAYRWAAALGAGDPEGLAGVVPYLFPGVPFGTSLGAAGRPGPLGPSMALRPLLPPATERLPFGQIQWREATARGLQTGDTRFDLLVKVDGSGVVAEFQEIQGSRGAVDLVLPAPAGYRLKTLYVDWEKMPLPEGADAETIDWSRHPVRVPLDPEEGSFSVFARLAPLPAELPTPPGGTLPAALIEAGLEVRTGDRSPPAVEDVVRAWGRAVGVDARVRRVVSLHEPVDRTVRGAVIDLTRSADPARLVRAVTSAIELRFLPVRAR